MRVSVHLPKSHFLSRKPVLKIFQGESLDLFEAKSVIKIGSQNIPQPEKPFPFESPRLNLVWSKFPFQMAILYCGIWRLTVSVFHVPIWIVPVTIFTAASSPGHLEAGAASKRSAQAASMQRARKETNKTCNSCQLQMVLNGFCCASCFGISLFKIQEALKQFKSNV